jgi:hypothetical protein
MVEPVIVEKPTADAVTVLVATVEPASVEKVMAADALRDEVVRVD